MKGLCQKYNFFILKTYKQAQPREKKLHYLVTFLENNTLLECITFKSIFPQHWSGVHINAAAFGPETLYWMTSNWTTQHIVNASSVSELYDWPRIDVLRQMVLNSYVLIPLLFCIHTEHHTGGLLVMLQLLILVHCQNDFTGILVSWFTSKTICVKGVIVTLD